MKRGRSTDLNIAVWYTQQRKHEHQKKCGTSSFPITSGILQGDVLAPYLFIMVLDRILHAALKNKDDGLTLSSAGTRKRGYKSTRVTDIDYADDLILFSDSKRSLERMVDSVATEASKANLSIAAGSV